MRYDLLVLGHHTAQSIDQSTDCRLSPSLVVDLLPSAKVAYVSSCREGVSPRVGVTAGMGGPDNSVDYHILFRDVVLR